MRDTLEQAKIDGRAPWTDVEINTRYFVVYKDTFPVTKGHTLVVPKQNTIDNILSYLPKRKLGFFLLCVFSKITKGNGFLVFCFLCSLRMCMSEQFSFVSLDLTLISLNLMSRFNPFDVHVQFISGYLLRQSGTIYWLCKS